MARVLVLASHKQDGAALRDLFEEDGHAVQLVHDPLELPRALLVLPQVVVVDMLVPSLGWTRTVELLTQLPARLQLVLLSCRLYQRPAQLPFVCFQKPIDVDRLRHFLRQQERACVV